MESQAQKVFLTAADRSLVLCEAVTSGHVNLVSLLLEEDFVPVNHVNDKLKRTAMHVAAAKGCAEVVRVLLQHGGDPRMCDTVSYTPLHLCIVDGRDLACVDMLLEHRMVQATLKACDANEVIDVNAQSKRKLTPMHCAALVDQPVFVQRLIAAGAELDSLNRSDQTPLHSGAGKGHTRALVALIRGGANMRAQTKKEASPLHLAVGRNQRACVQQLVWAGSPLDMKDSFGFIPIHWAAKYGFRRVAKFLIQWGSPITTLCKRGRSPAALAQESNQHHMTPLFEQATFVARRLARWPLCPWLDRGRPTSRSPCGIAPWTVHTDPVPVPDDDSSSYEGPDGEDADVSDAGPMLHGEDAGLVHSHLFAAFAEPKLRHTDYPGPVLDAIRTWLLLARCGARVARGPAACLPVLPSPVAHMVVWWLVHDRAYMERQVRAAMQRDHSSGDKADGKKRASSTTTPTASKCCIA